MFISDSMYDHLETSLILLYDGKVPPQANSRNVSFPRYILWLIREGAVEMDLPQHGKLFVKRNNWLLTPPNLTKSQCFSRDAAILSIHFSCLWRDGTPLLGLQGYLLRDYDRWKQLDDHLTSLICRREEHREEDTGHSFLRFRMNFDAFLLAWMEAMLEEGGEIVPGKKIDERVRKAILLLDAWINPGELPYERIRRDCGLSKVHFHRLFRETTHQTPREYVNKRILDRACSLLSQSAATAREIAFSLGFQTAAHFSRWFKERLGMTPGEYRRTV